MSKINSRRFSVKKMALKSTFGFTTVNHNYTEAERQILNSYHSLEYLPPHSKVYRNWLQQQPARYSQQLVHLYSEKSNIKS